MRVEFGKGRLVATKSVEGAASAPAKETAADSLTDESFLVEVVFRYRVPAKAKPPFISAVKEWAQGSPPGDEGVVDASPSRLAVWQPVVGSDPDVWEVRVSFSSHASLGQLMDEHPGRLAALQSLLPEVVEALDVANPVLRRVRTWDWPAPTHETGTTPDKS